jgi:hypothetical protein
MIKPEADCYYQHRYGGIYLVRNTALSTVDKSEWVVYVHIYPFEYQVWIRPYDEFCDGRFRKLKNGTELNSFMDKDRIEFQKEITAAREAAKKDK